jgi:phosphate transport system substrate-binding protein
MGLRQLGILALGMVIASLFASTGCRSDGSSSGGGDPINCVGSTSIQPFAELLAQEYEKKNPGQKVDVQGGGSTAGLQAVTNGLAKIGMCSRELTPEEGKQFAEVMIARDGLAIVVNPGNPVSQLKIEQIRGLFSGEIKNWKEVGGKDEPVRIITREESSGTRECFVHLIMGKDVKISKEALVQESSGAVKELVKGNSAAIGYISLGLVTKDLKALTIDGQEPSAGNVLAGKYKLVRPLLFVTKGAPSPTAQKFIDFVLSPESQKELEKEGLIRAR